MKKVIRTIAMAAILFTSINVNANEPRIITSNDSKSLVVQLEAKSAATLVRLVDTEGNVIFNDNAKNAKAYMKKFDLNALPQGFYILELDDSLRTLTYSIEIDKNSVNILSKEESLKPVYTKTENKLLLNLLNTGEQSIEIKVFDSNDHILFSEVVTDTVVLKKVFNFETAPKDTYSIVVKKQDEVYYETFDLK
ncbi:hypothetical protein ACEZ3G_15280 [Maribacter algicola]|uniref:Uncharacterized protein n=1 Tax=Meishania litoralis TaxID=3434685 RepID=A0ACC7LNR7_9FLAO